MEFTINKVLKIVLLLKTPDKENSIFIARTNVNMRDDDADFPALAVADYIMGGGAGIDSRLGARIRVKDGLSYGAGSNLSVGSTDRGDHGPAMLSPHHQTPKKWSWRLRTKLPRPSRMALLQ